MPINLFFEEITGSSEERMGERERERKKSRYCSTSYRYKISSVKRVWISDRVKEDLKVPVILQAVIAFCSRIS